MPHIKCYESLQPKTFNSHLGNKQCTQNEFSTKDFFSKCDQIRTIDKVSELLLRLKMACFSKHQSLAAFDK